MDGRRAQARPSSVKAADRDPASFLKCETVRAIEEEFEQLSEAICWTKEGWSRDRSSDGNAQHADPWGRRI